MASLEVKILPYDAQVVDRVNLHPTLERIYLPEAVFGDWAIRTGKETFDAFYTVRQMHCDPLKTPQLRGAINVNGNQVTNTFIIDEENPQGHPPHTKGHLRRIPLSPGHMAFGAGVEAVSFDQPMEVVKMGSFSFKGPGQPKERLLAVATMPNPGSDIREVEEVLVTINGREHAMGKNWVCVPSQRASGLFLPQFRLLEIAAQLGGAGMQTVIGPLPKGYAMIYGGIGPSSFVPCEIKPDDVIKAEATFVDFTKLEEDSYLFSIDLKMFNNRNDVFKAIDISLGLMPEEKIMDLIREALGKHH